jgi:L-2-hydroxyglutarate oxidase LhgO
MEKTEITIIGAGAVGLAVAAELSKDCPDILLIEKESAFGQGISSRNSEVIHAGIYYPKDSLKKKTCIEGRHLLYDFCAKNNVGHKKIGKLIVAIDGGEIKDLEALFSHGLQNGVDDLKLITRDEIKKMEPNVEAPLAIYSPSTGIFDTHGFMKTLEQHFENQGGSTVYHTEVVGIDKVSAGFKVSVKDKRGEAFEFLTRTVVNSAGLDSDKVAALAGLKKEEYRIKFCKGDYFRVAPIKAKYISRLIYPVPKKDRAGLGIHATLDLAGGMRLGPDDEYVKKIDYTVDPAKAKVFHENVRSFLPFISLEDLSPDMAGMRPKLQGHGEDFRDFIIKDEADSGLPGFINLIGIESPGLTGSLAIAKMVRTLFKKTGG